MPTTASDAVLESVFGFMLLSCSLARQRLAQWGKQPVHPISRPSRSLMIAREGANLITFSDFDLPAEFDDAVGRDAEEFCGIEGQIRQDDEQPVAPAEHGGATRARSQSLAADK